jgi:hypothetical protein
MPMKHHRSIDVGRSAFDPIGELTRLRGLVREATLAASIYNSQPWTFRPASRSVSIYPDWSRRCPVVDPDNHHLYVSLGCATENLVCGALANGLFAYVDNGSERIDVVFEESLPIRSSLYDALPHRQCSRSRYDGRPLARQELDRLERATRGRGVHAVFLTARPELETVLEYVTAANRALLRKTEYLRELASWIRFNDDDGERSGDGMSNRALGKGSCPQWLGSLLMRAISSPRWETRRCSQDIRSSSGIAVFLSDRNDPQHWIEVGRCYERFALQATALGIRNAFVSAVVDVPAIREQFGAWIGAGDRRPDLVVRFGRGPETARSRRRPIEEVLV